MGRREAAKKNPAETGPARTRREELMGAGRRYAELHDIGPIGRFTVSSAGRIEDLNPAGARMLGGRPEKFRRRSFLELVALESRDLCRDRLRAVVRTGTPRWADVRLLGGRGRSFWTSMKLSPWDSKGERLVQVAAIDISEWANAEQTKTRLLAVVEQAADSIVVIQPEGTISYVNRAFEKINPMAKPAVLGASYFQVFKPLTQGEEWAEQALAAISRGAAWSGRVRRRGRGGRPRTLALSLSPIADASGRIFNFVFIERDVTREEELEVMLRQAQRSAALAKLAGGIAHDLNNLLGPIIVNTEMSLFDAPADGDLRGRLEMSLQAATRAREIIKQILRFTSRREMQKAPVQVGDIVRESLALIRTGLPATIGVQSALSYPKGLVKADAGQIEQVLVNLFNNAVHAMRPGGGTLSIDVDRVELGSPAEPGLEELVPGPYLRVAVSDTGPGVRPDLVERIFDPFFTTKSPSEGTGLGLSVARDIVRDHSGQLIVRNVSGGGAVFCVFLPEFLGPASPKPLVPGRVEGGSGRILLVDDEALQVESWKLALERLGYKVTSTINPEQALRMFRERPSAFDLVITDAVMPGLDGLTLAEKVLGLRPALPVIITTGFSETLSDGRAKEIGVKAILRKPLGLRDMAEAVRKVLQPASQPPS